jgi:purine-cytosine permease-like protein
VNHHSTDAVPLSERRDSVTMGLLWITMVTAFPTVLAGFQFNKDGMSLGQVLWCSVLSCVMLLAYAVPAAMLGAKSGQTYSMLARKTFGRYGAILIAIQMLVIFVAWYGLTALICAESLHGIYSLPIPVVVLAVGIAFAMAFNNFFGFSGVANFARYVAAPSLILWVGYTLVKALGSAPPEVLASPAHCSLPVALTGVSAVVLGFAVWGNEPDYWRYGKPKVTSCLIPMSIALCIGQIIFPTTGWIISKLTGITEYGAAANFMTNYSFGGVGLIAAIVLTVSLFAVNDSNLYGSINAIESLKKLPHRIAVTLLAIAGCSMALFLSVSGAAKALESIAALNCILLPMPTVIMMCEWWLVTKLLGGEMPFAKVVNMDEVPAIRWPALISLIFGCAVGIMTAGLIPGLQALHVGISSVQSWITACILFIPLRILEHNLHARNQTAGAPIPRRAEYSVRNENVLAGHAERRSQRRERAGTAGESVR